MQYLISRNYGNIQLCESASDEYVSVMVSQCETENFKYCGIILMQDIDRDSGMLTYFRTNPAFRESSMCKWIYTDDKATILAFITDATVYVVVGDDNRPVLVKRDYSNFYPVENKTTNNVYQINESRRI